jgi:glycosyltransferase involved in cell wall biosynthesis
MPRVSILMPVRNGLPWLREALESIASQTLRDFELLVLEDGSTDGTAELLSSWRDDRLRVISTGGVGMATALNLGLDAARAPLVARHDADDVSAPDRLEAQVRYMASHRDVGVLATVADYIDALGQAVDNDWVRTVRAQHDVAITSEQIAQLMPLTCCVTHGSVMARTAVLRAAGGYQRHIWPAEDYDLWLRLLPQTAIAKLHERLYRYRIHDTQLSAGVREQQLTEALCAKFRYVRRECPQLPTPARLAVVGTGRGADCYRMLASSHGFVIEDPIPSPESRVPDPGSRVPAFDALVVANFADVAPYAEALDTERPGAATIRIGNFFIPRDGVA